MALPLLNNPILHRYWFYTSDFTGFGVTAYTLEDARRLLQRAGWSESAFAEIQGVTEDVDIRALDYNHVRVNMGPPNFRGIWHPCLNLRGV